MEAIPSPRIGRAAGVHLDELCDLAARTFRDTFAGGNKAANLEHYIGLALAPEQLRAEFEDPSNLFFLAWLDETTRPAGYAKLRTAKPVPSISGTKPIELHRLYVEREAIGRGVGSSLMRACLAEARRGGFDTLWLGVWEHNPRAIGFYRRWRFSEVGDQLFLMGSEEQRDLIMQRPV